MEKLEKEIKIIKVKDKLKLVNKIDRNITYLYMRRRVLYTEISSLIEEVM